MSGIRIPLTFFSGGSVNSGDGKVLWPHYIKKISHRGTNRELLWILHSIILQG